MEISKFFNSAPGDPRVYQASDFADFFGNVLSTGLLHVDNQPELSVTVGNGLTTVVGPGKAIMQGYPYENTSDLILEHALPEATLDRIDRIVLRLDKRNQSRFNKLFVVQGEASVDPVPPELTRDEFIYELSLARIRVRANTASLEATDLFDERLNEDLCGLARSLISIPTSQFQQQWDAWFGKTVGYEQRFEDWFEGQQREGFVTQADYDDELKNEDVQIATLVQGENIIQSAMKAPIKVVSMQGLTEVVEGQGFRGIVHPTIKVGETSDVLETTLHGMNGFYDEIIQENREVKKVERFRVVVLDSSLPWIFGVDFPGRKTVSIPVDFYNPSNNNKYLSKYDGKLIVRDDVSGNADTYSITDRLYLSIADPDSGWGESYTPTANEIKAYFLGWKMYTDGQGFNSLYNGAGTKAWTPIETLGSSGCWYLGAYAPTVKASPSSITGGTYKVMNEWNPYKLVYQLATSEIVSVSTRGTAMLEQGENVLKLAQGIVTEEKVTPVLSGDYYFVNATDAPSSLLDYKLNKVIEIYKDNDEDTENWLVQSYPTSYGEYTLALPFAKFDPTATYHVTYEILPELTAQIDSAEVEYSQNIKSIVDEHTDKLATQKERLDLMNDLTKETQGMMIQSKYWWIPNGVQGWVTTQVFFDKPFNKIPEGIVVSFAANATERPNVDHLSVVPESVTRTGFKVNAYMHTSNISCNIYFIAIGK